jgi:hypothetical protein
MSFIDEVILTAHRLTVATTSLPRTAQFSTKRAMNQSVSKKTVTTELTEYSLLFCTRS